MSKYMKRIKLFFTGTEGNVVTEEMVIIGTEDSRNKRQADKKDTRNNAQNNTSESLDNLFGKSCMLWSPVHSVGQGYLKIGDEIQQELGCFQLASIGTNENATVFCIERETHQPDPTMFVGYIKLNYANEDYYLRYNDEYLAAYKGDEGKTLFKIVRSPEEISYRIYVFEGDGNGKKMLKIGGNDTLKVVEFLNPSTTFIDPACLFKFLLVEK